MVLGLYFTNKAGCGEECPGGDIFAVNTRSSNIVPREDSHGEGLDVGVQPSTVSIHSQADDDDTVSIILEVGAVYLDMAAVVGEMCVQIFFSSSARNYLPTPASGHIGRCGEVKYHGRQCYGTHEDVFFMGRSCGWCFVGVKTA